MVILEAKRHGVPVICSNIGGMREKIDPGSTGLHFLVGRTDSLAGQMAWAAHHRDQLPTFRPQHPLALRPRGRTGPAQAALSSAPDTPCQRAPTA